MMPPARTESALYLDQASEVDRFLDQISDVNELALDTEGASFHRFLDRIYLLQISTREHSAIIDPLPIGSPAKLGQLLQSNKVEVIFHDADYDLRLLHQDYGWHVTKIFDTRIASQLLGIKSFGLAALLEQFFDVKLDKKHQRADWSMRPLTPDMLEYAAQDTRYLLQLKDHMKSELQRRGRLHWAEEEFARLEGTRWEAEEEMEGFLRLKGARDLTRRELAVLREVANGGTRGGAAEVSTGSALEQGQGLRRESRPTEIRARCRGDATGARSRSSVLARTIGECRAKQRQNDRGSCRRPGSASLADRGNGRRIYSGSSEPELVPVPPSRI